MNDRFQDWKEIAQWMLVSEYNAEELVIASPHSLVSAYDSNIDIWLGYRNLAYVSTAYAIESIARILKNEIVQYDRSWFVVEAISEATIIEAIIRILQDGGLHYAFEPMNETKKPSS